MRKHLIPYILIGILASSVDILVFNFFVIYIHFFLANFVSVSAGMLLSYTLNLKMNFKIDDGTLFRGLLFSLVNLAGMIFSSMTISALSNMLELRQAKVLSIGVVAAFQFVMNTTFTFKRQ